MRIRFKTLTLTSVLLAGLGVAPVLYAHDLDDSDRRMMGRGGMMGMGGMMNMMRGKGGKMEGCRMMMGGQSTPKPNEQWRDKAPAETDKKG